MIDLRRVISGLVAAGIALAPVFLMADANARDARWLREERRQGVREYLQQRRNSEEPQRLPQRFSPEERRQLRRDIQDAGREIYPRRR